MSILQQQNSAWVENQGRALYAPALAIASRSGGGAGSTQDIVFINHEVVERVKSDCRNSVIVMPATTQVVMAAVSGISVKIYSNGRWMEPNDRMQDYIDEVFLPFAQQQALRSFEEGLMSYSWDEWEADPRLLQPYILREGRYKIGMVWKKRDIRQYKIFRARSNGAGYEKTATNTARVVDVHLWKPRDNGSLSSPFSLILQSLERYNRIWTWYNDSIKDFTKPLLVLGGNGGMRGGGSSADPLDDDHHLPGDVSAMHDYSNDIQNQQRRKQYRIAMATALLARNNIQVSYNPVTQSNKVSSSSPLFENQYTLPEGEALQSVVSPSPIPEFLETVKQLQREILEALMVPGGSKAQDSSTHAATAELTLRTINDLVQQLQELLARPLGYIYEHMIEKILDADLAGTYFEAEEQQRAPLSQKQRKGIRKQRTRVMLTFDYAPLTTYESLKNLYEDNIINQETFGEYGLKVIGIPPGEQLSEAEVRKQVTNKRKLLELETPEYMKQKAQPAAAQPSSSSSSTPAKSSSSSTSAVTDSKPALKKQKGAPAKK